MEHQHPLVSWPEERTAELLEQSPPQQAVPLKVCLLSFVPLQQPQLQRTVVQLPQVQVQVQLWLFQAWVQCHLPSCRHLVWHLQPLQAQPHSLQEQVAQELAASLLAVHAKLLRVVELEQVQEEVVKMELALMWVKMALVVVVVVRLEALMVVGEKMGMEQAPWDLLQLLQVWIWACPILWIHLPTFQPFQVHLSSKHVFLQRAMPLPVRNRNVFAIL